MTIRGKYNSIGYWFAILAISCGTTFFLYFLVNGSQEHFLLNIFGIIVYLVLLGTFGRPLYDANIIEIDSNRNHISFKNQFTGIKTTYAFSDFDGKLFCFEPIKGGQVKNLYLIKNKIAVKKISELIYSNYNELESGLLKIQDLGTFEYSYKKTWKISFRMPIIE